AGSGAPHSGPQCADRSAAGRRRAAGGGQGAGFRHRGRASDLSAGGGFRNQSNQRFFQDAHDRNRREIVSNGPVVEREFLEFGGDSPIIGRGGDAAGKAKDENYDDQSSEAGYHRA